MSLDSFEEKAKKNCLPINSMQVLLNKQEKEQLVIDLHQQGKTIREIAQQVHMSFGDIGKIIRTIDGGDGGANSNNCSNKSADTKALNLFLDGKRPIDVAIELDLLATEVEDLQQEYWILNQLEELAFVYNEIKNYLPSFMKLFHALKEHRVLTENHVSKLIKYADQDLPYLTNKIQWLINDVIDLEFKKTQTKDVIAVANTNVSQLRDTLNWYQRNIELKRQMLRDLDTK